LILHLNNHNRIYVYKIHFYISSYQNTKEESIYMDWVNWDSIL